MSRPEEDSFLARWSRRKRAPEQDRAPERNGSANPVAGDARVPDPIPDAAAGVPEETAKTDAEILEELGLKDPDEMEQGDDFAAFLKSAVPEHLRRRALRRLWRSNPVLACVDGLNDYDTDFTGDTVAPGLLQSSYRAGSGYLSDLAESLSEQSAEPEETAAIADTEESERADNAAIPTVKSDEIPLFDPIADVEHIKTAENDSPPPWRRMKFRIAET